MKMVGTAQARLCPPYRSRHGTARANNPAAAKRLPECRIWPRARLVCAVWRVNDPATKPLETKPSVVHYGAGGRIGWLSGLEAKSKMRSLVVALAGLVFAACTSAQAKVA